MTVSNENVGENEQSCAKRWNWILHHIPKSIQNLFNDLTVKTRNCKPPRSKQGNKLFDIDLDNDALDYISKTKKIKKQNKQAGIF